jgi:tetratricopeptide (TPR) repeat protein
LTYSKAVDAVRYVQHDSDSSNEIRADLIVAMITCSNNAGTCSVLLHKWDQAIKFAKNALVLIDALYPKRGGRIHTILNRDGYPDSKIFGEWRVKSYLLLARAQFERKDYDTALETLRGATAIINEFHEKTSALVLQEKEVKKLKAHCEREDKAVKKLEKKRARAMFGGGTSPSKEPNAEQLKNGVDTSRSVEFEAPLAVSGTDSGVIVEPFEEKSASKLTKKVSFSVPEAEEFEEEEVPWLAEHWEALTVTVAFVVVLGLGVTFGGRRKQ